MKKNDGGLAFPNKQSILHPNGVSTVMIHDGMTLRQWYAGRAMQGILSGSLGAEENKFAIDRNILTEQSFIYADAMIAFEEKENEKKS